MPIHACVGVTNISYDFTGDSYRDYSLEVAINFKNLEFKISLGNVLI